MLEPKKLRTIIAKIKTANNILILGHARPDGDAIASVCAVSELCRLLDKKFTPFFTDIPDPLFYFLDNFNLIKTGKENLNLSEFDLIIVLDCGSVERTGIADLLKQKDPSQFIIDIDHHPKISDYADLELKNPESAATAEIVYFLLKENKIKINKTIANCILTGILTDTGNLLYPSTSEETIKIASEMLTRGARFPEIIQKTWYNKSLSSMKLWGLAMSKLTLNKKYNIAFSVLTLEEIQAYQADEDVFTNIVAFMSNLSDAKGVLLLREEAGGKIKGSLRTSQPDGDISQLAQAFGGGGHPKSSGFVIEGRLEKTESSYKIT